MNPHLITSFEDSKVSPECLTVIVEQLSVLHGMHALHLHWHLTLLHVLLAHLWLTHLLAHLLTHLWLSHLLAHLLTHLWLTHLLLTHLLL